MWLADDDPVRAEHLERDSLLGYFSLLNKKMADAIAHKRRNMTKHRGSTGTH